VSNINQTVRPSLEDDFADLLRRVRILEALTMAGPPYLSYIDVASGAGDQMEASILAEPGRVHGWVCANEELDFAYVKLYNTAGTPVLGTTAQKVVIPVPPELGANMVFPDGIEFDVGIGVAVSLDPENTGSTGVADESVALTILYLPATA